MHYMVPRKSQHLETPRELFDAETGSFHPFYSEGLSGGTANDVLQGEPRRIFHTRSQNDLLRFYGKKMSPHIPHCSYGQQKSK